MTRGWSGGREYPFHDERPAVVCRDIARRDLEQLEATAAFLLNYIEDHMLGEELLSGFVRADDSTDPRCVAAVKAHRFVREEIHWTRTQLQILERATA